MQLSANTELQSGKYRIIRVLGQGGFGITYLAEHTMLDKMVAIKEFFPKEYCDRDENSSHMTIGTKNSVEMVDMLKTKFIKEAKNISKLNHRNIITIHDIFQENDTAYYVMEYVEGASLSQKIKEDGALPENKAVEYIRKVADAVGYMHSLSMNHLDLKPANIMVRAADDEPILIDFGLSKQYDASGGQTSSTPVGISHGFAPIEQYRPGGVSTFTPQTDIYALGATLFNLLTGYVPPHYSDIVENGFPQMPSFISSKIVSAIQRALSVSKNERPATITEWLSLLECVELPKKTKQKRVRINDADKTGNITTEDTLIVVPVKAEPTIEHTEKGSLIRVGGVDISMIRVKGGLVHLEESSFWSNIRTMNVQVSDFEIATTVVTRRLWNAVMGKGSLRSNQDYPVTNVNYDECLDFVKTLNDKTGLKFRLPTQAEWEYAASGGHHNDSFIYSGSNDIEEVGWCNSNKGPYKVGLKRANSLGIYDMSGNVCEWCMDWYGKFTNSSCKNYKGPNTGETKVLKGGSFYNSEKQCKIHSRLNAYPFKKSQFIGFRLIREL